MRKKRKSFTLIEILVVIAIIGLLTTIVFIVLDSAKKEGRDAKRAAETNQLRLALNAHYTFYGYYPNPNGSEAAACLGEGGPDAFWNVLCDPTQSCLEDADNLYCLAAASVGDGSINGGSDWGNSFKEILKDWFPDGPPKDPVNNSKYRYIYGYTSINLGTEESPCHYGISYCSEDLGLECDISDLTKRAGLKTVPLCGNSQVVMSVPIPGGSTCGNGVCGIGEDKNNCPFDCLVAALNKEVKITNTNYNTTHATYYPNSGTPTVYTGSSIKTFIIDQGHIDLSVSGALLSDGRYYLIDQLSDIPVVDYAESAYWTEYLALFQNQEDWRYNWHVEANTHEDWFLHQLGQPVQKETRILRNGYNGLHRYNWSDSNWREQFTDYNQSHLINVPTMDGLFYDELIGYINLNNNCGGVLENTTIQEQGGQKLVNILQTPDSDPSCLVATVKNSASGESYTVDNIDIANKKIYLSSDAPTGVAVVVNYRVLANLATINVKNEAVQLLNSTKSKIGGKLLIYNGFTTSGVDNDPEFLSYADGAYMEGPFDINIALDKWLIQVNKLATHSQNKIVLVVPEGGFSEIYTETIKKHAMFSFCSFLLAKERYAYFGYAFGDKNFPYFEYWDTPLGAPLENYHQRSDNPNVYEREYEKALILVNISSGNASINLGSDTYEDIYGSDISGTIELVLKSGMILKKQ